MEAVEIETTQAHIQAVTFKSSQIINNVKSSQLQPIATTLDKIVQGGRCVVKSVSSLNNSLRSRLLTMGIIAGTVVEVSSIAPLRDPITIKARNYSLSLRLSEASQVKVVSLPLA